MNHLRLPMAFLPTFKSICNHIGHQLRSGDGVPILGNKLYDACSRALNHQNFNALKFDSKTYGNGPLDLRDLYWFMSENLHRELSTDYPDTERAVVKAIEEIKANAAVSGSMAIPDPVLSAIQSNSGGWVLIGGGTVSGKTSLLKRSIVHQSGSTFVVTSLPDEWKDQTGPVVADSDIDLEHSCSERVIFDDPRDIEVYLSKAALLANLGHQVSLATYAGNLGELLRKLCRASVNIDSLTSVVAVGTTEDKGRIARVFELLDLDPKIRQELSRSNASEEFVSEYSVIYLSTIDGIVKFSQKTYREYRIAKFFESSLDRVALAYLEARAGMTQLKNSGTPKDSKLESLMYQAIPLTRNLFPDEFEQGVLDRIDLITQRAEALLLENPDISFAPRVWW